MFIWCLLQATKGHSWWPFPWQSHGFTPHHGEIDNHCWVLTRRRVSEWYCPLNFRLFACTALLHLAQQTHDCWRWNGTSLGGFKKKDNMDTNKDWHIQWLTKWRTVSTTSLFVTCPTLIKPISRPNFSSSFPSDFSTSCTFFISLPLSSATTAMARLWACKQRCVNFTTHSYNMQTVGEGDTSHSMCWYADRGTETTSVSTGWMYFCFVFQKIFKFIPNIALCTLYLSTYFFGQNSF